MNSNATVASTRKPGLPGSPCNVFAFLAMLVFGIVGEAAAQTTVGGTIASDTTWTAAQSPYRVQSDITVINGAVLTIDSGTIVQVEPEIDISVVNGAIRAIGLSNDRIVITSVDDVDPDGSGAHDYWGHLAFLAATNDAATVLENVDIRYGSGLIIESASPTLRNVAINHNDGPAISIDLQSSPQGHGLSATGNLLNGIRVPAGQINEDVIWALRGIPYVVQDGVVSVGGPMFGFTPDRLNLALGATAVLELALPDPAPEPGGTLVTVESLAPSFVEVTSGSPVSFSPGQSTAQVTIQALSATPQVLLHAHHPDHPSATARVRVVDLPTLQLTPSSLQIEVDAQASLSVSSPNAAPALGLQVTLSTNCPACLDPLPEVVIPAGETSTSFVIQGRAVGDANLTAQAEGHGPAHATIQVRQPFVTMPASFIVPPSSSRELQFALSSPPASDVQVSFVADPAGVVSFVSPVTVPSGQTTATIQINAGASEASTQLTAQATGYEASTTAVQVRDYQLSIVDGIPILPQSFAHSVRIRLNQPAPAGGMLVQLGSDPSGVAGFLAESVLIPENQTESAPVQIVGIEPGEATLTATAAAVQPATHPLTVVGPLRVRFSKEQLYLGPGLRSHQSEFSVQLVYGSSASPNAFIAPRDVQILFENGAPDKFNAPEEIFVAQGWSQAFPRLEGVALTGSPVTLSASIPEAGTAATVVEVHVVEPTLTFEGLAGHRTTSSPRDDFSLRWQVPGASSPPQQISSIQIAVAIHEPQPSNVVDGIFGSLTGVSPITSIQFPMGGTQSNTAYIGVAPKDLADGGHYQVSAQAPGYPAVYSALQHVDQRELRLEIQSPVLASGVGYPCRVRVRRYRGGQQESASPLNVTISTTNEDRVSPIAHQVTINNGSSSACVGLQVPGLPDSELVQINAADGSANPAYMSAEPLSIEIVHPAIRFHGLGGIREVGSERQDFWISICTEVDSFDCSGLSALQSLQVELALADMTNPPPVATLHLSSTNEPISGATIPQGSASSALLYVGLAEEPGEYRVRATTSVAGGTVNHSEITSVQQPSFYLRMLAPTDTIGRGMYSSEIELSPTIWNSSAQWFPPEGLEITSSDPTKVEVPEKIFSIAPGLRGQIVWPIFNVKGLALTEPDTFVELVVSAPGYADSEPLLLRVAEPFLGLEALELFRESGEPRDGFYFRWFTEGTSYPQPELASPHTSQTVHVELIEVEPKGLVNGIYDDEEAGELIASLSYHERSSESDAGYVASPVLPQGLTEGSYRLRASVDGYAPIESDQVLVAQPAPDKFRVTATEIHVGTGLFTAPGELQLERVGNSKRQGGSSDKELVFRLRCAASTVCSVPELVVLKQGQRAVDFPVRGLAAGSTVLLIESDDLVDIEPVHVIVRQPELRFAMTANWRELGSGRARLKVHPFTKGARFPRQPVAEDWKIDLRADASQVLLENDSLWIKAGQNETVEFNVDIGGLESAQITASRAGVNIATTTVRRERP